jgi:hypothetical protein
MPAEGLIAAVCSMVTSASPNGSYSNPIPFVGRVILRTLRISRNAECFSLTCISFQ